MGQELPEFVAPEPRVPGARAESQVSGLGLGCGLKGSP